MDDQDPIAATEAMAMPVEPFWVYLEALVAAPEADVSSVVQPIVECGIEEVLAFDARLTLALHALDGQRWHDWYLAHDPDALGSVSDDAFLYARCDTLLTGRDGWQRARDSGTLPWGAVEPLSGEWVLGIGMQLAEATGVGNDDYFALVYDRIPISYETGSNESQW